MKSTCVIFGCFLFFTSCKEKGSLELIHTSTQSSEYPNVDSAFWPYFERFEQEAMKRGLKYDLKKLGISAFKKELSNGAAGQCQYSSQHPERITIDKHFWEQAVELEKELILFHELGHCVLAKKHNDSVNESGYCNSIMRSSRSPCVDNYTNRTRQKYLDELFSSH